MAKNQVELKQQLREALKEETPVNRPLDLQEDDGVLYKNGKRYVP